MPSISVVVPCYNCEKTINRCVTSLIQQTIPFFEIILVDDGSSDSTGIMCDHYQRLIQSCKVCHQANSGLVSAWKKGVSLSTAEYIVFCDGDDKVDSDYNERLQCIIESISTELDLIVYGLRIEYEGGRVSWGGNLLSKGFYGMGRIKEEILPHLFYNGNLQSELITSSRCCKAFKRELLCKIMDTISNSITFGEDNVTMFAAVLNAKGIYCTEKWAPYHYMRNMESMTGQYDASIFKKISFAYSEMSNIADRYHYQYKDQLIAAKFSISLVYSKKEATRNPNGYKGFKEIMKMVFEGQMEEYEPMKSEIRKWSPEPKVFASLLLQHHYFIAYWAAKLISRIKGYSK